MDPVSQAAAKPSKKFVAPIIILVVIVIVLGIYWFVEREGDLRQPVVEPSAASPIETPDLGSDLLEKASNPVKDKLPGNVAPVPNPLEGVYQNPFE